MRSGWATPTGPDAVMYPYYKLSTGLTDDDIAGIRALYGSNVAADSRLRLLANADARRPHARHPRRPPPAPTPASRRRRDTTPPSLQIKSPGFSIISTTALGHRHQRDGERQRRR